MLESVNEEVFLCILQSDVHSLILPTAKNACNSDTVWPKAAVSFDSKLSRMDCYYLPPQLAVWCVCCQHLHSSQSGLFTDKAYTPRHFHGHWDSIAICLGLCWRCLPHLHLHPLRHWCWGLHCVSASQSSPRGDSMPSPFPALCRSELKQAPIWVWVFMVMHYLQHNLSFLLSDHHKKSSRSGQCLARGSTT